MGGMETFTLVPRGPFSLAASTRFLEGFTPASYSSPADSGLEGAFPAEGSWRTVGVRVSQAGDEVNAAIVSPAKPDAGLVAEVRPQVERILALDVDGSGFPAVGENWRPYRTWVTLLLRIQLEYETGEITGRPGHARTG